MSDANNKEVDLFFVLGAVIDPEDVVPDEDTREIIYLRDQPVRDVLDKLMKQQMERSAFSTVLHNMSRYVQVVHWRPYPEAILNDYALFLNTLVKHTSNWRRTEWDINPLFTMSAILLKEHPYYFAVRIPRVWKDTLSLMWTIYHRSCSHKSKYCFDKASKIVPSTPKMLSNCWHLFQ